MEITVSAPGKVHLLGEHAVVYGRPALLAAVDKRLYVKIKYQSFDKLRIGHSAETSTVSSVEPLSRSHPERSRMGQISSRSNRDKSQSDKEVSILASEGNKLIQQTISIFKGAFLIEKLPPIEITITSQIPIGCGFGSSAALAAGIIGALIKSVKNLWNPTRINELAFEVEKIAHGNPSGADNTAVVFGGLVWYRREFEFLTSIWSLPVSSYKILQFVAIDSSRPKESTKEMVAWVASLYKKKKKVIEDIFFNQEMQTKRLLLSLRLGDKRELIAAMRVGGQNLEKMGVVGSLAKKIIKEIERIGGAAKICGAGGRKKGSGILLCYHEDLTKVAAVGKRYNLPVSPLVLGGEGIRIEKDDSSIKS